MRETKGVATKTIALVIAAVIVVAGISAYYATRPPALPKGEIVVWHGDAESVARITEELIETSFNQQYPDIIVRYELAPEPFKEKLLITLAAGTGPDLFVWNHDWMGTFVEADLLLPIDDLVTSELRAKYVESAIKAGKYEGKQYLLPLSAEAVALAYNKEMMGTRPVPTTTDELVALMAEFKEEGLFGISFPMVPFTVSGYIHAFGGWLWDDESKTLGVNSSGTKAAMEWILEKFKPYMSEDASWGAQVVQFTERTAPLAINGPWMLGSWRDAGIDFGLTLLPKISELGDKDPETYTGVKSIFMTTNAKNVEAAFAFMEWFTTNREHILTRATELGYIPVLKEVLDLPEIQADPNVSVFAQQVALGKPMAASPEMVAVWGPLQEALDAMWAGVKSVDEALDDAQVQILEAIAEM